METYLSQKQLSNPVTHTETVSRELSESGDPRDDEKVKEKPPVLVEKFRE